MAPASSNTVQLVVQVVDANSGAVISTVTKNIDKLGTAAATAGNRGRQGLEELGSAGAEAGGKVAAGMDAAAAHTLRPIDNVRLFRDDLGIKIPRAMEMVIAKSSLLSGALNTIGTGLVALGGAELVLHMGEQVYNLYERWLDAGKAARDYGKAVEDIRDKDVTSTRTIEATRARIGQTSSAAQGYGQIADGFSVRNTIGDLASGRIDAGMAFGQLVGRATATKEQYKARGQADQLQGQTLIDQQHQLREAQIETAHAGDAELQGRAKVNAELQKKIALLNEQKRYERDAQRAAGNTAGSGNEMVDNQLATARAQAAAEGANINRKEQDEVLRARRESQAAGLQGEQRYRAELANTIAATNRRIITDGLSVAAAEQLNREAGLKAEREYQQRRRAELAETTRMQAEAAGAGLTGLAKQDAELKARMDNIAKESPTYARGDTRGLREAAAQQASRAEQQKSIDDFRERIQQMDDGRTNSSMSANQRIDADTRRTVAEITKVWTDLYGGLGALDARRVQGQMVLNAEIARINASAAQQKQENTRTLTEQTRKMEDEAARLGLPRAQEQTRAVLDDYSERIRQLEELRARDADNADLYRRQEVAAEQIKNGKLIDLARERRDKLAGELRGFMSNPLEALKRQGEEVASKFAADMLLGRRPGSLDRGQGDGSLGSILSGGRGGNLLGLVRPTFGRNNGVGGGTARLERDLHGDAPFNVSQSAQQAIVRVGTATIYVGSASFAGMGSGAPNAAGNSAIGAIASGGYAPTGNGGFFNMGTSPSTSASPAEMGSGGGSSVQGVLGTAQQGYSQANSLAQDLGLKGGFSGLLRRGKGSSGSGGGLDTESADLSKYGVNDADGNPTMIGGEAGSGATAMGKLGGAATGALGVYAAFQGKGGFGGAASGALSGAQVGLQYGGLAGAAIGAVVGGVLGFIGHGARVEAQKYWFREIQPKVKQEMGGFEAGTADYQSVYDDLTRTDTEAKQRTHQMGSGAVDYYNERIHPELMQYQQRLTREQKAGRSQFGMTAAQFDVGGRITDFGSLATYGDHGFVHAQKDEFIVQQGPAADHYGALQAIRAGASHEDMASYYGASSGGDSQRNVVGGSSDVNLHFHSPDARGVMQLLMDNKHHVRAALNSSYMDDSGGAD